MPEYMYFCPNCKVTYKYYENAPRTCGRCGNPTIYTGYEESEWYSISKRQKSELLENLKNSEEYQREKENIKEAQAKTKEMQALVETIKCTTGFNFEGYSIVNYFDVIFDEVIVGVGLFKSISASLDNLMSSITGSEATEITEKLAQVKGLLRDKVALKAVKMGANALIGIDFESSAIAGMSLIMISMTATAVKIEPNNK